MNSFTPNKATAPKLLAWYCVPATGYCHLVELDQDLVPCPTPGQEHLIVYPDVDPVNAGHFFASNGGKRYNLN